MANNVDTALRAKDEASKAFQSASMRLQELRGQIEALRSKGSVNLTVGDTKNLSKLTSEAGRLERALQGVASTGTQGAAQLGSAFGNLQGVLGSVGLGGLGGLLTGAGLATAAVGIGKVALSLEAMREESAQLEARFTGFTGGVQNASAALRAYDTVLGNALTRDEKMASATKLLGLGLADTAQDAATLAKQALILGIGLDTLTQALETGRVTGLVQYGISVSDVKRRAEELQQAQSDLTTEEAKALAIKEQLAVKAAAVAQAGGEAATSIQRLKNQWEDLKDTAADAVVLKVVVDTGTEALRNLTFAISPQGADERKYGKAFAEYQKAAQEAATIQEFLNKAIANGNTAEAEQAAVLLEAARAAETVARVQYEVAAATQNANLQGEQIEPWADAGAGASYRLADGLSAVKTEADGAADAIARVTDATANAWYTGSGSEFYGAMTAEKIRADKKYADDLAQQRKQELADKVKDAQTYAKSAASSYESAMKAAASKVQSALSGAITASINLADMRGGAGDVTKPGANGPFEAIYRAQAIAKGGIEGAQEEEWAKMYGLTPESAARIVADFQKGLMTPEVLGLVDVDALVQQAKLEEAAKKSQEKFASEVAKKAGVGPNIVSSMLGFGATKEGESQDKGTKDVGATMDKIASAIGETVSGKDFAGKIIGFGDQIWGHFEKGIVDAAKKSSALMDAIEGMVYSTLQTELAK